jgi:hypothetical protein
MPVGLDQDGLTSALPQDVAFLVDATLTRRLRFLFLWLLFLPVLLKSCTLHIESSSLGGILRIFYY